MGRQGKHCQKESVPPVGACQIAFGVGSDLGQMTVGRNMVDLAQRPRHWCFPIPWNSVYWDEVILFSFSFGKVERTLNGCG